MSDDCAYSLGTAEAPALARKLHADESLEIDDICKTLRICRSTFYRYVWV